jgi:putative phosphoribosyl transferase
MAFRDREQAGRMLAGRLTHLRGARPVILGLARGGVPVAREVARELGAGLEVLVARKLGAPQYPEYAIGAVAEGGALYVRPGALAEVGIGEEALSALVRRETAELARRVRTYRGDRPLPGMEGRTAIVVDDGVATGATARAAARAVRQAGASRVVLAAPVIAEASREDLLEDFDEVVAVRFPEPFGAVGAWYDRFDQVTDDEVRECLGLARAVLLPGD